MNRVITMLLAGMLLLGSTYAFAEDVYVTKNGKKYHKTDCLLIKNKGAKPISLEDAQKKGLKPCRKCFSEGQSTSNNTLKLEPGASNSSAPLVETVAK